MTGTVTAEYLTYGGAPAKGTVTFGTNTTDQQLRDPDGNVVYTGPRKFRLVAGELEVELPATDDVAFAETGWQYWARIELDGAPPALRWFELPDGDTVNLADIAGELAPGDPLTHPLSYADVVADIQDPESVIGEALSASIDDTLDSTDIRTALNARPRPARAQMVLTFDDSPATDWTVVKPILDAADVKGTFCLLTGDIGSGLTWAHASALAADGHELAAHSVTHANLGSADAGDVADEVTASFAAIKTNTGLDAAGFCYPYGANNDLVRAEVRRLGGYGVGDSVEGENVQPFATYNLLRRHIVNGGALATYTGWVDAAIADDALLIVLVHSSGDFDATQQSRLAALIAYAQGLDVPIVTLSEALAASGNLLDAGDYPKGTGTVISGGGTVYSSAVGAAATATTIRRGSGGDLTLNGTSWFSVDTGADLTLAAVAGDIIEVGLSAYCDNGAPDLYLDVATWVSGATVNHISLNSGGGALGVPGWLATGGRVENVAGSILYVVQSGDIASGTVTLRLRGRTGSAANRTMYRQAAVPYFFWAKNVSA